MATPKQFRRRGRWSLIIGVVFVALTFGAVYAFADTVTPDGDTVVALGDQQTVSLGTVAPGEELTPQTSFRLTCTGKSHPDEGQTLSLSFTLAGSNVPAGGGLSATNASIGPIPASWPDDTTGAGSTNCAATPQTLEDTGNSTVTITAPLAPGFYTYVVRWNFGLSPADPNPGDDATAVIGSNTVVIYTLTVSAPVNSPPIVDAGDSYEGDEGSNISLGGASASDPGGSIASSLWSIDSQSVGTGICSLTNAASLLTATINCTDNGTAVVKLLVTDNLGATASDTANVTINNVAPTGTLGNNGPVNEGSPATISFTGQSDPSSVDTTAGFHYAFSCSNADLSGTTYAAASTSNSQSCTFYDNGSYPVSGAIVDKNDGVTTYTTSVSVTNVAPDITSAAFASSSVNCGTDNATLNVSFADPGTLDTWTADVDWENDGTYEDTGNSVSPPSFSLSHTYATAGSHTAKVRVTDDDLDSDTATATLTVNYNMSTILQPVNDTRHGQQPSMFKYGSTIPVKIEVTDCDGSHPSGLDIRVTWITASTDPPPAATEEAVSTSAADTGNKMRFSDPIYIFNVSTKAITADPTVTVRIDVKIQSTGQLTWAFLGLKK